MGTVTDERLPSTRVRGHLAHGTHPWTATPTGVAVLPSPADVEAVAR